jgi:glycosyltransferase involved in cell wall biosynthesis
VNRPSNLRIAWLLPVAWFYWQPFLSAFAKLFPDTQVFTGLWPGFAQGLEDSFAVTQVGRMRFVETTRNATGYGSGFTVLSLRIVGELLRFRPQVVFADSFRIWTLLALLLKPLGGWRVVLAYEGSSPGVDYRGSALRLWLRRRMVQGADAYITNSRAGALYLCEVLGADQARVFARPYEVPDIRPMLADATGAPAVDATGRLLFLCVGHTVPRKGLPQLLAACLALQAQGVTNYRVMAVGDGEQRQELMAFVRDHALEAQVSLPGRVEYGQLGAFFEQADAFVFPTLEDTWGTVVLEAMLFAKPVLCSRWAGTAELIREGENGFVFDPYEPERLAEYMRELIDQPRRAAMMGMAAKRGMADYTPEAIAAALAEVVEAVLGGSNEGAI